VANRRKNRRDLDTQGLPDGCKTLGRGREKKDRTGEIRGRTLSLLRTDVLCSQHKGGRRGGAPDEPYVNNPGYRGHLLWNPDDLLTLTNFAVRRGWKIGIHAIGKRAHRTLLDVYEQVIKENPGLKPGTLVLEHGFLADAGQRASAIRLGIPVTIQHPLLYTLGSMQFDGWGNAVPHEEFSGIPHGMLAE